MATTTAAMEPGSPSTPKPIHSLVLDTGPLIKNDPPVSVLLAKAEALYTLPSVIPEIRDPATRSRVETTLLPFVTVRAPRPESLRFVQAFARRTGDLAVLSRPDLEVLALGYELECERNGGDWRLRNAPGQKGLNGRPPQAPQQAATSEAPADHDEDSRQDYDQASANGEGSDVAASQQQPPLETALQQLDLGEPEKADSTRTGASTAHQSLEAASPESVAPVDEDKSDETAQRRDEAEPASEGVDGPESDDDDDGWITPSNVKKHQAKDAGTATPAQAPQKTLQAAILTSDYAMQNVALRMNLNLVTPALARITQLKNWVLRCHGCFALTRDMAKQFCPSCGQPTLLRTSCSTDEHGRFRLHLKRNFQWNRRGNVYSVPKPVHGSASGRAPRTTAGGGKNGWGRDLVLAEDQKEYVRAAEERRRAARARDPMDDDYLPGILSGDRSGGAGGRIRVGAGRNVNAKSKR
ncbi:hypothetical protein CDD83_8649 [Cordyceps sp. RAO-2017]|nr:hypothetical protein CDD83_8649 [Cordyceps sp. RAO-2017]